MSSIGEVRACAHCQGRGFCSSGNMPGNMPCVQCYRAAGSSGVRGDITPLTCSVCEGKGSVWVGPKTIYIREDE
jgi:DnaJ-class molecular chaperone